MTLQDLLVFALGAVVTAAWMTRRDLLRRMDGIERIQAAQNAHMEATDSAVDAATKLLKKHTEQFYSVEQDFQQVQRTTGFTRYGEQR